ncbi:hypothetical protein ALC53_11100 [Atta colombica]|uniref:Uncharacterized protein n=1 Tax=Atta colombica TaxID=520822 RepID=A0A195B2D8_9HYME|nr:hypothetical protein ALC53_11100 [Atta colombica]
MTSRYSSRVLYRRFNESYAMSRFLTDAPISLPTFLRSEPDERARQTALRYAAILTCLSRRSVRKQVEKENIYSLASVEDERGRKRERDDEKDILARALQNGPVLMDSRMWYEILPDFAWSAKLFLIHKLHQPLYKMFPTFSRTSFVGIIPR